MQWFKEHVDEASSETETLKASEPERLELPDTAAQKAADSTNSATSSPTVETPDASATKRVANGDAAPTVRPALLLLGVVLGLLTCCSSLCVVLNVVCGVWGAAAEEKEDEEGAVRTLHGVHLDVPRHLICSSPLTHPSFHPASSVHVHVLAVCT